MTDDDRHYLRIAAQIKTSTSGARREFRYDPTTMPEYREAIRKGIGVDIAAGAPDLNAVLAYLGDNEYGALAEAWRAEYAYRGHVETVIKPALRHALGRVDATRSPREMVGYIRRAFMTEYSRLDREQTGIVRLGRRNEAGDFTNLYVTPKEPQPWRIIFDRDVRDLDVPAILNRLTRKQRGYIEEAHAIVERDIEAGDMREYKVDDGGHYRMKSRYIARRLGIGESNFRKCLANVRKRAVK
ncbi:hypothetical protein [Paenibacillus durus]|uniref:hypothetical protein n=1 Tax=Paenibacillus durus TaxID=44251 RepID=UPI0012E079C4|nr:hypothetical protein [Paenibacillus durus]